MREIKFRAWNGKRMYYQPQYFDCFKSSGQGNKVEIWRMLGGGRPKRFLFLTSDFMQYTGLKDKNGREIYEGDIVKAPDIITEDQDANYSIKWNDSYARFVTWHDSIGCCQFLYAFEGNIMPIGIDKNKAELDTRSIEIIGNIYENPELIKKEVIIVGG